MKQFFESAHSIHLQIVGLLLTHVVFISLLNFSSRVHVLMVFLLMMIASVTLFSGTLVGLIISLILLFVIGTVLIAMSLQLTFFGPLPYGEITLSEFIAFGMLLIVAVLLAGSVHERIQTIHAERQRYLQQITQYVAIDAVTSFDNAQRMAREVKAEMARVGRHGGSLTLLFVKLDHYKEFYQVYGERELQHLLKEIGRKSNEVLRSTDRKFRYTDDCFAYLLVETNKLYAETIIEKMAEKLQTHQLQNGKTVTLTYHISFNDYNQTTDQTYEQIVETLESELVFYAM